MTAAIDITKEQRKTLLALLHRFIPGVAVWAYGSRVKWTARPNSDLDLVAFTTPAQSPLVSYLKEALAESNLPFLVDFHVWDEVPERFHKIIRKEYVIFQEAEEKRLGVDTAGDYPITRVGVLADSISETHKMQKEHLIFLNTSDILHGKILHRTYTAVKNWPGQAKKSIRKDDILFSEIRPANGRWAFVEEEADDYVVSTKLMVIRARKDRVFPKFLYQYLTSTEITSWLQHLAESRSGTFPQITFDEVASLELSLPPIPEQKIIANILGTLDDKIELNRRMNVTLDAMARALFQSWFVDFDPVRAKLDGRKPADLDAATAALFPAHFQDSPIGPVPKGWKVERFDAHITAERGLSYKGEGLRDDGTGLPMHNLNSIYEGGGYKHEGIKYYAGEYREKHLLKPGDMIVTNTEQGFDHLLIGHAAIVPECYGPKGLYSHHIYRVRHKPSSPFSPHYLVELFNNRRWHYWISGFSNGTTINMLPMDALEIPMLVIPPDELVNKFNALAEAAHLQVEANKQQSRFLATLRDALLPKLLSGEVNAMKATSELEAVT